MVSLLVLIASKSLPLSFSRVLCGVPLHVTQAIGRAAIQYFEAGGNIEGLAAVVNKAFSAAVAAAEAVHSQPSIRAAAQAAAPVVRHTVAQVLDAAAPVAQSAARTVWRSVCPGRRGQGKHAWGVLFAKSPGQH